MYDLLPVSWFEVVPQHKDVRFDDGVLVSKCPSTKMYVLLPVSWSIGAPGTKMYVLLQVSWS